MWFSLPQTFQPVSPYNPYQTFYTTLYGLSTELTTRFTRLTPYASLARVSKPIPSPHLVPPYGSTFSNHIPISHTSQLTTHATYISSIYGVRMPSQHSKPAHIYNNTISKIIPRHHYDKETSTFR